MSEDVQMQCRCGNVYDLADEACPACGRRPRADVPGTMREALDQRDEARAERDRLRAEGDALHDWGHECERIGQAAIADRDRLRAAVEVGNKMMGSMRDHASPADEGLWLQFELALADLVNDGLLDRSEVIGGPEEET